LKQPLSTVQVLIKGARREGKKRTSPGHGKGLEPQEHSRKREKIQKGKPPPIRKITDRDRAVPHGRDPEKDVGKDGLQ